MATLREHPLPLNPPNPYGFYLQFLTPRLRSRLYYTKYIVEVIGELAFKGALSSVREWTIPPALYDRLGGAAGIVYGPTGTVWFALQNVHRLVELDPRTGEFRSYGGGTKPLQWPPEYPFPYPRHLMFDGTGALWCTGAGKQGALVARLDPSRRSALYWELPIDLLTPEGIWVEQDGRTVWLTPINPNVYLQGAFLASLDVARNRLTLWYPAEGARPVNAGVVGDRSLKPENVWFSYDGDPLPRAVYRFDRGSGTFFVYRQPATDPRRFALDSKRAVWVSDWAYRVSRIEAGADCGRAEFKSRTVTVKPVERAVKVQRAQTRPVSSRVHPVVRPVVPAPVDCYLDFPLPYPLMSHGISLDEPRGAGPIVFFTHGSANTIGELHP